MNIFTLTPKSEINWNIDVAGGVPTHLKSNKGGNGTSTIDINIDK